MQIRVEGSMKHIDLLLAVVVLLFLVGCSTERSEAKRFCKVLYKESLSVDILNPQTAKMARVVGNWASNENRVQPSQTKSVDIATFTTYLSGMSSGYHSASRALAVEELKTPFLQITRNDLVQDLEGRAFLVEQLNLLLQNYARDVVNNPKATLGMSMSALNAIESKAGECQQGTNKIQQSLREVRLKYSISDSDLSN